MHGVFYDLYSDQNNHFDRQVANRRRVTKQFFVILS